MTTMHDRRHNSGPPHAPRAGVLVVATLAFLLAGNASGGGGLPRDIILTGSGGSGDAVKPTQGQGAEMTSGQPTSTTARAFRISGSAAKLYPGLTVPLVLTVTNLRLFPLVVTSLTVSAGDASGACVAANLSVNSFSGHLLVPAGGTAKTTLQVAMNHAAPDACQGAKFPLRYSGTATK
jgi:hypothetical protein